MSEAKITPKKALRRAMRQQLRQMTDEERHSASNQVCARLMQLDTLRTAGVIMLYLPLPGEVDIMPIVVRCFQMGKMVCVPRVDWDRRDMNATEIGSFQDEDLEIDEHGVRTPQVYRPVVPTMIDVALVPGLAFDTSGHRLGRGGGYYDRFLPRLRRSATTIGVAFDGQIVDAVDRLDHDIGLDLVVTDRRTTGPAAQTMHH